MIVWKDGNPIWKETYNSRAVKGSIAGNTNNGYRRISITHNGKKAHVAAHRLHWFMVYGEVPDKIDHINRNRLDNRIENLRLASQSQNNRNRTKSKKATSIYRGVSWDKTNICWIATGKCPNTRKSVRIGNYKQEIDAAFAWDKWCTEVGVDEFSNLNFPERVK